MSTNSAERFISEIFETPLMLAVFEISRVLLLQTPYFAKLGVIYTIITSAALVFVMWRLRLFEKFEIWMSKDGGQIGKIMLLIIHFLACVWIGRMIGRLVPGRWTRDERLFISIFSVFILAAWTSRFLIRRMNSCYRANMNMMQWLKRPD
jgi:hypothetical protein